MASIEAIIVGIVDFKKNLMIVAFHSPLPSTMKGWPYKWNGLY
jgi:hypothetical protein